MNRRAFLKSIATVCGAAVVCPGELLKGESKSAAWGRACSDYRKGWKLYVKGTPDCLPWSIFGNVVCVKCITSIKEGQILIWNPNGTVRSGSW